MPDGDGIAEVDPLQECRILRLFPERFKGHLHRGDGRSQRIGFDVAVGFGSEGFLGHNSVKLVGEMFAKAADATVHDMAEKSRQNKKKAGPPEDEPDTVTAEVVDDEKPSGAADTDAEPIDAEVVSDPYVKVQIINNPTIVNQNGEKNIHIEHLDVLNL